ncbi:hypothetical protein C1H46_011196 [Malus baccata]|uniref:GDSL esterase/lipase n=1 Tax=Malus baccata TaxID=106549 RepID=A0A540MY52_MALBA|nr:hypothetical protein C1H46_011196 [Malus baccata]
MTCSSAQSVPAFFIFGDSAADVGNNNYVATVAKANTIPNGIDFGNPTGRFTNGRTVFDILQQQVGFKNFSPAYLAPTTVGDVILQGVNYAASASGIFNSTGSQYGETVSFDTQLKYHGRITLAIMSRIGVAATQKLLRKSIYAIALGANDILSKDSHTSKLTQDEFLDFVISRFRSQLQVLRTQLLHAALFSGTMEDFSAAVHFQKFVLTDQNAANLVTAKYMMEGNLTYMFPMNVRQLVQS